MECKSYYAALIRYCQCRIFKKEILQIVNIFEKIEEENNYFELIVIFRYGETDRIDIANIQMQHINQFLKSMCSLLLDLKNFSQLSHNNISIKNIVLIDGVLKISGFKPILFSDRNDHSWKKELALEYGCYRLDLFLIGLLWLKFF